MREIASLERDPAEPNYLAHIDGINGVDFSGIGRGLNLRSRQTAREQAKIWSALSWRKTPDGGYLLSRNRAMGDGHIGARVSALRRTTARAPPDLLFGSRQLFLSIAECDAPSPQIASQTPKTYIHFS